MLSFIEGWGNPRRRHSALGYKPSNQFDALAIGAAAVPPPDQPRNPGHPVVRVLDSIVTR